MAPEWRHGSIPESMMGVSLSIKDVPEALAERLRERARRNHRSLQRELMALVEAATSPQTDPVGQGASSEVIILHLKNEVLCGERAFKTTMAVAAVSQNGGQTQYQATFSVL